MNPNISQTLKDEIDELVKCGDEISSKASISSSGLGNEDIIKASSWVTRIGQIIKILCSESSQYYKNYEAILSTKKFHEMHSNWYKHTSVMTGIIKAIQNDFEKGLLVNIKQLLQAEIFADFLEMGEYLLQENYKDAAAVIIGSVLEDSLRKLAISNGISILKPNGDHLTMEPLNIELAKAKIYNKLIQKQVTSWGELRNRAAHGEYNKYDKKQVEMMLLFVQKFCSDYLT